MLIEMACGMLGRHLGTQRCGFGEADADGVHYRVERDWTDGTMPSLAGIHRMADFGEAVVGELRAGRSLRVDDVASDPRTTAHAAAYEEVGASRAVLSVPLVVEGRLWASVFVTSPPRVAGATRTRLWCATSPGGYTPPCCARGRRPLSPMVPGASKSL
nr:GAF domain-containing protein [Methylorubrum sp. GM97]